MALAGCAEEGAAEWQDSRGALKGENLVEASFEKAFETLVKSDDLPSELSGSAGEATQDGIESGAVAAACEHAEPPEGSHSLRRED
jgi:hypothetical protein